MGIKIGMTTDKPESRRRAADKGCDITLTEPDDVLVRSMRLFYAHAEKLMKKELQLFQLKVPCSTRCGTKEHTEYFEVRSDEVAFRVFQRWRTFCMMGPWDDQGNLSAFWLWRLNRRRRLSSGDGKVVDEQQLSDIWDEFVYVSKMEEFLFVYASAMGRFWPWRWQLVSLIQAIVLSFSSSCYMLTTTWLAFIAMGLAFEAMFADFHVPSSLFIPSLPGPKASPSKTAKAVTGGGSTVEESGERNHTSTYTCPEAFGTSDEEGDTLVSDEQDGEDEASSEHQMEIQQDAGASIDGNGEEDMEWDPTWDLPTTPPAANRGDSPMDAIVID